MAKIVIAGSANCPYYAKVELLADNLATNLPDFHLHKIVKQPSEWENWLQGTCKKRGWTHESSPLVWRELVDRGGKGMLIGGANDFQEYTSGYYGIKSKLTSVDIRKIASENMETKLEVDEQEQILKAQSKPVHVCVTCGTSPVCYGMIHALAKGDVLGPITEVALHLHDTEENMGRLQGVEMEVFDLACPLLRQVVSTSNLHQAFSGCSVIVLLDEIKQGLDETKEEWLKRNNEYFIHLAKVIEEVAKPDVKILVSGNGPVNFNTYMMLQNVTNIPCHNIVAMSRQVENQAKAILAERLQVNSAGVVDVTVWGNSNGTSYIDVSKSRVHGYDGAIWGPPSFSVSATEMVHDEKWLQKEFLELLSSRKKLLETALNHTSAMSEAAAMVSLLNHWWNGSPSEQFFSLGVCSEGWYGIPEGIVFSVPVNFSPEGTWRVVRDMELDEDTRSKLDNIVLELTNEIEVIYPPAAPKPAVDNASCNVPEVSDQRKPDETAPREEKEEEEEAPASQITENKTDEATDESAKGESGEGGGESSETAHLQTEEPDLVIGSTEK